MAILYNNNAYSTLAVAITTSGQTSVTVATGHGDRFPIVASPDVAYVTLENTSGTREIIKITARASTSDVLTVARGQEGTTATTWSIGDIVEQRITAGELTAFRPKPGFTTTVTAAGTTTLTKGSTEVQEFTGSSTQTITLPVVTTLETGYSYTIINSSTGGALTVNSSGSNLVATIPALASAVVTCVLITGTTAASWSAVSSSSGQMLGNASSKAIFWNAQTIAENVTIGATQNGFSVGPVTISTGYAVTITTGGKWTISS